MSQSCLVANTCIATACGDEGGVHLGVAAGREGVRAETCVLGNGHDDSVVGLIAGLEFVIDLIERIGRLAAVFIGRSRPSARGLPNSSCDVEFDHGLVRVWGNRRGIRSGSLCEHWRSAERTGFEA